MWSGTIQSRLLANSKNNLSRTLKKSLQRLNDADKYYFSTSREDSDDYEKVEGLRPFHKKSTDLAYSRINKDKILQMSDAIGFSNIWFITTITPKADRSLLHSSLNILQTRYRLDETDEKGRSEIIADKATDIYSSVKEKYERALKDGKLPDMALNLDEKLNASNKFITKMTNWQESRRWDYDAFAEAFPLSSAKHRHESKAIEIYRRVNERIANGVYTPDSGSDAQDITREFMHHNILYKHQRRIGVSLVDEQFNATTSENEKLTAYPVDQRKGIIIFGGMGSGKTYLSSSRDCSDVSNHNADFLKTTLHRHAVKDGVISAQDGLEVTHNESAIVLFESGKTRTHDAKTKGTGPNVLINSIGLNEPEIREFLENGRGIDAHHVSMDTQKAVDDCNKRAKRLQRTPNKEGVLRSYEDSARSLLNVTQHVGENIKVYLYERTTSAPKLNAKIDTKKQEVDVIEQDAFKRTISRSNLGKTPEESASIFIGELNQAGFKINEKQQQIASDKSFEEASSALSVMGIAQYKGSNVEAHLYDGKASEGKLGAIINCKESKVDIYDTNSFQNMLAKSNLGKNKQETKDMFMDNLKKEGFKINYKEKQQDSLNEQSYTKIVSESKTRNSSSSKITR
jgi:hypothetical protein